MPWIIAGVVAAGGFLVRKFAWKRLFGAAATGAVAGAGIASQVATPAAAAYVGGKFVEKFPWWILAIVAPIVGLVWFVFLRKPAKKKEDTDFYAGALGIDPAEASKLSKAYLSGKLSAQRREAKWGNPGEILGLRPKGVTAHYGSTFERFGGS